MNLSRLIDCIDETGFLESMVCEDKLTTDGNVVFRDFDKLAEMNFQTLAVEISSNCLRGYTLCYFRGDEVVSVKELASHLTEEDWKFLEQDLVFEIFCIRQDDPQKLQSMNIKPYSMKDGIDFGQQWRSKSFQEKLEAIESLDYLGHRNLKKLTQPYRESVILYEKNKSLHNPKR